MPGNDKCNEEVKQDQRTGSDKGLVWIRWSGKRPYLKRDLNISRTEVIQVSEGRVSRHREEQRTGE